MRRDTSWAVARAAAAAVVFSGLTAANAYGQADTNATASGNWSDTQNPGGASIWDNGEPSNSVFTAPNGAPTFAIINNNTVTIDQTGETALRVDVGTGAAGNFGTLVMTGGNLTISEPEGDIGGSLPGLRVGAFANGLATVTGGTITAADEVLLGYDTNGVGTLNIGGLAGSTATVNAVGRGVVVGVFQNGTGTLNLHAGGTLNSNRNIDLGRFRDNVSGRRTHGTFNIDGGVANVTGGGADFVVGFDAEGVLNLSGDGVINVNDNLVIGIAAGTAAGGAVPVARPAASGIVNHGGNAVMNCDEILVGENGIGTYNMTSGTINSRNIIHLGLNANSSGAFTHSGGALTTFQLLVGRNGTGNYALSGNATIDANVQVNVGTFTPSTGTMTQSGTTRITTGGFLVAESGQGTFTISENAVLNVTGVAANGGSFPGGPTGGFNNLLVGRNGGGAAVGVGTMTQAGGTVNVATNVFLGDFDDSNGTYRVSGGALNVTGNLNVGAALASNAPPDATRTGTQGQALGAVGTFVVSGSAGDINVGGDFLANAADKTRVGTANQSHLGFEIFGAAGTSLIEVASAADLDGAVVDMSLMGGYTPAPNTVFNLMSAGEGIGGPTGTGPTKGTGTGEGFSLAAGDATDWTLRVVPGLVGGSEFLQAVYKLTNVARTLYWDVDGATPGGGGPTPAGNWDGSTANFNTDATGGAGGTTTGATTDLDTIVFAAGADGGGSYAVNLTGTRAAAEVQVARGNVTLAGGTLATGSFDVAAGASGTVSSLVSGGATGAVAKKGAGVLMLTANNAYTGGTNVQAGTLRVNRLHENNPVNITGGKLQVIDSSPTLPAHPAGDNAFVSRPSSLTIANNGAALGSRTYNGQLDLGNNDLILDYSGASPIAEIEDMIRAGYNGGNWLGNGIASSTANANPNFAIGVADNSRLTIQFNAGRPFSGQVVDATTILVKFTHRIDLDLDGVVTTNDATIFNSNYVEGAPAYWSIGDLDYDRVFTTNDATLFNGFYGEALASVPEPASLGVLGIAGAGLLARRRRGGR